MTYSILSADTISFHYTGYVPELDEIDVWADCRLLPKNGK